MAGCTNWNLRAGPCPPHVIEQVARKLLATDAWQLTHEAHLSISTSTGDGWMAVEAWGLGSHDWEDLAVERTLDEHEVPWRACAASCCACPSMSSAVSVGDCVQTLWSRSPVGTVLFEPGLSRIAQKTGQRDTSRNGGSDQSLLRRCGD